MLQKESYRHSLGAAPAQGAGHSQHWPCVRPPRWSFQPLLPLTVPWGERGSQAGFSTGARLPSPGSQGPGCLGRPQGQRQPWRRPWRRGSGLDSLLSTSLGACFLVCEKEGVSWGSHTHVGVGHRTMLVETMM